MASSQPTNEPHAAQQQAQLQQNKFEDFRMTQKLGEGTFSEVLKVKHKSSGKIFAMKRFRKRFNSTFEEIQNLREIQALRRLNPHPHVIDLIEVIFDQKHGVLALNFELMDCNLYELISRKSLVITESKAKGYFYQICKALEYMHSKGIFHRDIKPENILVKDSTIKLADFGSCRGIHSKQPYTEYIATRWYRSPECLLCDGIYTYKMDLWGAGCVLYEIISKLPLFPGTNELDQLNRIHNVVGTPTPKLLKKMLGQRANAPEYNFPQKEGTGIRSLLPHVSADCLDLINAMLVYDPDLRISSKEALKHAFFKEVVEKEKNSTKTEDAKSKTISSSTKNPRAGELSDQNTNSSSTGYIKTQVPENPQETSSSNKENEGNNTTSKEVEQRSSKYNNKQIESSSNHQDSSTSSQYHHQTQHQLSNSVLQQQKKTKGSYHDLLSPTASTAVVNHHGTITNNSSNTTASSFYDKVKKQTDDRLAMEVALARARRAKRKNSNGSTSGKRQNGSSVSLSTSTKGSWSHGISKIGGNEKSSSKLPILPAAAQGGNYKVEKVKTQSDRGFPSINVHGIHPQDKRASDVKVKDHFTLPSISTNDSKTTNGNVSLAGGVNVRSSVNGPTALPQIKQGRDYR